MKSLVFIKIGGSLLTDKSVPYQLNSDFIAKLGKLLPRKLPKDTDFIIGTGGGSFGHYEATRYKLNKPIKTSRQILGAAVTHLSVQKLQQIVAQKFLDAGKPIFTMSPSSFCEVKNGKIIARTEIIESAFKNGFIPLVHGDGAFDDQKKVRIISTESVGLAILQSLKKKYSQMTAIFLTNVDGIIKDGEVMSSINRAEFCDFKAVASKSFDVTNGIYEKIEMGLQSTNLGIKTIIANGNTGDVVKKILRGDKIGTKLS
ncbi:MAG: hypothetical protein LBM09_01385 [Candidatus Nomurabacteria bacterium]|jgi:isopentenyl phosphate kinase|nr:hypothetical protein [Candidatus Nomurabacteria bacterium]